MDIAFQTPSTNSNVSICFVLNTEQVNCIGMVPADHNIDIRKAMGRIMKFAWTEELSVGNRIIDSAHKDILSLLNRLDYLIGARDGATLAETFKLLENCLRTYFEAEEKIAQAINFDFYQHKLMHHLLLSDFLRIRNILAEKNGMWSDREGEAFTISLVKCFVQHIKDEGVSMKIVLDAHYYDFQPD